MMIMARTPYPSDLTDAQWQLIEPFIPPERWGGRTRSVEMRQVVNAILYLVRTGCQWRAMPHEFPKWQTVRFYYDRFRRDGTWELIHQRLRDRCRWQAGRSSEPSSAIIDSQSVRAVKGGIVVLTRVSG
jgi:putative transposase